MLNTYKNHSQTGTYATLALSTLLPLIAAPNLVEQTEPSQINSHRRHIEFTLKSGGSDPSYSAISNTLVEKSNLDSLIHNAISAFALSQIDLDQEVSSIIENNFWDLIAE